ncbi:MAG TPA: hypothetical protein VGF44_03160 [Terriglobales bacterium]|jgi:hypothetical protein
MDNKSPNTLSPAGPAPTQTGTRRKRRNDSETPVRHFLLKPGSSATNPELGQEVASEGEALIQAFKGGQVFYTLAAWKAVPEVDGSGRPVIVKQAAQK